MLCTGMNKPSLSTESLSHMISSPIFLVGCERSGTTLTMLMLNHHPQIAFFNCYFAVEVMPDEGGWPDMDKYLDYLATDRLFSGSNLVIDRSLDYPHLVNSFLRQKQVESGKPLVGGKIRDHFHRLLRIWPDARFIHLIRDGRDVARSLIEMGWVGNMLTAGEYWLNAERQWEKLSQLISPSRWTELRYEDLVKDPNAILSRVCEFMGVAFHPAMLDYPKNSNYGPPSPKMIGQWKRKLRPRDVQLAESLIGDMLVERGYELSGFPALRVRPPTDWSLRLQDKWYRARFKCRRYGTGLYLACFLARRLGLRAQHNRILLRLNQIESLYLK
jgi:hypothetical protein